MIPIAAYAGTAPGNRSVHTTAGVAYWDQSVVITSSGFATGQTKSGPEYVCVGPGWIGTQGRLVRQDGGGAILVSQQPYSYSTVTICPGSGTYWQSSASYAGSGNFYSYGYVHSWNGSSYNWYDTFPSPLQPA